MVRECLVNVKGMSQILRNIREMKISLTPIFALLSYGKMLSSAEVDNIGVTISWAKYNGQNIAGNVLLLFLCC